MAADPGLDSFVATFPPTPRVHNAMDMPPPNRTRKIAVIAGSVVAGVLVLLLVLPRVFAGPVEARVRSEIEQATRVRVSWSDVGLGVFRSFPHATLALRDLTVEGTGGFEGDTLANVGRLDVTIDLWSALRAAFGSGALVVRSVRVDEPVVRLRVRPDGTANWDVMAERPEASEPANEPGRALAISLRRFELSGGDISLENDRSGLFASLVGLDHSLRGDFSRQTLDAATTAHADQVTLRFAGVPYLSGVALDLDAQMGVDMAEGRVRLEDNELRLNDLVLRWAGEVARQDEENLLLDLSFEAPGAEFGEILSLVPAIYAQDFASLETSGTFAVNGTVDGTYGPGVFPALQIRANIADGSFRYPDLPLPARAITADLAVDNPGGDLDNTVVSLSRFHVEIGDQPLDAAFTLRTPVSDPEVDARVQGTLDLDAVAQTVKLGPERQVGGVVVANASVRARRSDVDSARYENIAAEGTISAADVTFRSPELRQPVAVEEMQIELTPERADLRTLRAQLGSSDLQASGELHNLLAFALDRAPLAGTATFSSQRFVLDEWRSGGELSAIAVPPMLDLALSGDIAQLEYGNLTMTDARGDLRVQDQRLTLDDFTVQTLGGSIGLDGWYETLDPTQPTFELALAMDSLDVNQAAETLVTVSTLAPVARYARGTFSADLDLNGALGEDMRPVLDVLDGGGSVLTSRLAIEGMPLLDRLSDMLRLSDLANPTVSAIRSSIRIEDGRLHVSPFDAQVAGVGMNVSGSNGIDQSLDYTLALTLPTGALGEAATSVVSDLARRAGLPAPGSGAGEVRVAVRVGGTMTEPALDLALGNPAASAGDAARQAAGAAIEQRVDEAQQRLDAEREEARQRARAQADSLVADAERRAEDIRAEAARLAAGVREEGNRAADEILARAGNNPLARAAAEPAAARVRQEAETRASTIEREAAERADALVAETRARADQLTGAN